MQLLPAFTMSPRFKEIFESSFFSGSAFKIAIKVYVNSENVLKLFILVLALALLGWIYPVINALKVSPIDAIQGAK